MTVHLPWVGHLIEIASLFLFGWCWLEGRRERKGLHVELLVAVGYGCLLEIMDMAVFQSYHYGQLTWLWVGHVPLYIPLLWATIIHSSMAMSDQAGLPEWAKPFADGLFAVLIDLAIDAIAIRLGLWQWGIPINEGWYGVPAGNLCAWMWVAACYGWTTRLVRRRIETKNEPRWHRLLIPMVAYTGLFTALYLIGTAGRFFGLEAQSERLWMFAVHVAGFIFIVALGVNGRRDDFAGKTLTSLTVNRWLMHLCFFTLLIATSLWRSVPGLAVLALATLVIEWRVQLWCAGIYPRPLFSKAMRHQEA